MSLIALLLAFGQVGEYYPVETFPGTEAYRLASYTIMTVRRICWTSNNILCRSIDNRELMMSRVANADKQVVNGANLKMDIITTVGRVNMSVHYDSNSVHARIPFVFENESAAIDIQYNLTAFEAEAPPCTPSDTRQCPLYHFPVCADEETYMNSCQAKLDCKVDVREGAC